MLKLGITGGIGSGKSTVSELFKLLGVPVYNADTESKKLTDSSPKIQTELVKAFGENMYENGILNKQLLASYIFGDQSKRAIANGIIHPEVRKHFEQWVIDHSNYSIIAEEAAILFETGMDKYMDKVIMVYAPIDIRIQRVLSRDGSSKDQVLKRINSQMSDEDKLKRSDFVINNDGSKSLIAQVLQILETVNKK